MDIFLRPFVAVNIKLDSIGDDGMQLWVNAAQMKAADQYTIQKLGIPSLELMEHAAQACVQTLKDETIDLSHVCVVCGSVIMERRLRDRESYKMTDTLWTHFLAKSGPLYRRRWNRYRLQECGGKIIYEMPREDSYSVIIDAVFGRS